MKYCLIILLLSSCLFSCAIRKQGTVVSHHEKTVMLITDEGDSICWRVRNKPAIGERFWAYFGANKITKIKAIK